MAWDCQGRRDNLKCEDRKYVNKENGIPTQDRKLNLRLANLPFSSLKLHKAANKLYIAITKSIVLFLMQYEKAAPLLAKAPLLQMHARAGRLFCITRCNTVLLQRFPESSSTSKNDFFLSYFRYI